MALSFNWKQPVDDWALESGTAGTNETRVQLYMDVDEKVEEEAIKQILGYPKGVDPVSKKMIRQLPMSHPRYPHLYGTRQGLRSYKFTDKVDEGNGPRAQYAKTRITVDFAGLPYTVVGDNEISYEWQRFVERSSVTTVENIVCPSGQFMFLADAGNPAAGKTFQQGRIIRFPKTDLVWVHHQVHEDFLFQDKYGTLNQNIRSALGTVNQYWFPSLVQSSTVSGTTVPANVTGFAPGTLLYLNCTPKPMTAPCSPGDLGFGDPGYPARIWAVEHRFLLIDPPVEAAYGYRGHNLFPVRQGANGGTNNNWYLATGGTDATGQTNLGTASGTFLYPKTDFNLIFKAV